MKVRDDEEAIALMNDSPYGLTASIWTADTDRAIAIGDRVGAGKVRILFSLDGRGGRAKILDEDGAALVIHENRDDHATQPIGGAGARVFCGVIKGD